MHYFGHRGNALLTFAVAFVALMCALASLSDHLLNSPSPTAQIQVSITMNISADLKSLFTWNTKQISLWDGIIPSKKDAEFWVRTSNRYDFIHQGSNLRGKDFNLALHWHVIPKTGKMSAGKIVMSGYRLPEK